MSPLPADRIRSTLESLDLSGKEIDMYLTLLQVGTSPSSALGRRSRLSRSTAQYTCDQLVKKGIARASQKGNTRLFSPEPPEKLLLLLERQHREIERKERDVQDVLEPLRRMMNPHSTLPRVQFFEGKDGIVDLYDKILDLRSPIDSFEDKGEMLAFIPDYVHEFVQKRVKRGITNRVICPAVNQVNVHSPQELRETRTLPESEFPFTCDIKICEDLLSIFSFDHHTAVGVAIRHADIANNFRVLFESYWRALGSKER